VVVGYGTPALCALALLVIRISAALALAVNLVLVAALVLLVVVAIARADQLRYFLGAKLRPLADILVLGVLVAWGLVYNSMSRFGLSPQGQATHVYLALAEPEVTGLVGLHLLTVVAYAGSRRFPGALPRLAEPLVHALLIAGILLHAAVAVQLRGLVFGGLLPPFLPLAAPLLTVLLYTDELVSRLRRRGAESTRAPPPRQYDSAFRRGSPEPALPPSLRIHRPLLALSLLVSLALLGAWAVAQRAAFGGSPLQVFTRTSGHTFSAIPTYPSR
jgi:hypothetical protein